MLDPQPRSTLLFVALLVLVAVCAHGLIARDSALEVTRLAAEQAALAAAKQHDAQQRLQLVGHVLDTSRSAEDRQRVLRYLYAVTTDVAFRQWAEAELASLQPEVDARHDAREADAASLRGRPDAPPATASE